MNDYQLFKTMEWWKYFFIYKKKIIHTDLECMEHKVSNLQDKQWWECSQEIIAHQKSSVPFHSVVYTMKLIKENLNLGSNDTEMADAWIDCLCNNQLIQY